MSKLIQISAEAPREGKPKHHAWSVCKIGVMSDGKICDLGNIVEGSVKWDADEPEDVDNIRVREKMLSSPLKIAPISVNLAVKPDLETLLETYGSVSVMGEPVINKPKNLKYPNKKRARRIWKKWRRRFGLSETPLLYIPKARIDRKFSVDGCDITITCEQNETDTDKC